MPHHGERGRITEEILRGVLAKTLPKRFSIGTGVIFNASEEMSLQTDIVIYDNFLNSPLLSEFGSCMFPVETVYATIEVKSVLTKQELRDSMDAIMRLRALGKRRYYTRQKLILENGEIRVAQEPDRIVLTVPPRNYIVAFSQSGLGPSYQDFCDNLRECLDQDNSHVHGVCVLNPEWFAGRRAFRSPAELFGAEGNALFNFYVNILKGQRNFSIYPMDLDEYLPKAQPALET